MIINVVRNMYIRFELLDLLRSVSVVTFFPGRVVVGGVLIIAGTSIHVVASRSALVLFLSASSPYVRLQILTHPCHMIYICLLPKPTSQTHKNKQTHIHTHEKKII